MSNPKYWQSQWYATMAAEQPFPGGWYWHDEQYNWFGPFEKEPQAAAALAQHEGSERAESDEYERTRSHFELLYHPLSLASQKVLIAIYEKNLNFTRTIVDLDNDTERLEFTKLYAMGTLPLVLLNHGPMIPESTNIIEYLDSLGRGRLVSEDPDIARKTRYKDRYFDLYLTDSVSVLMNSGPKSSSAILIDRAKSRLTAVYEFLDFEVRHQTWANGEEFAMSDCAAAPALLAAQTLWPYDKYPRVCEYVQKLRSRPSVERVWEEASQYRKEHAT
ncbi:MAG: glutathione S-transferase family protein [Gammaproteobacteria bacterium]|nr:glutathione S-transferase family protein [Gammaproteobacteria bacterium]MDH3506686.1 glutathione S-transferase family protein [Gammaproteobacteria bacterium]